MVCESNSQDDHCYIPVGRRQCLAGHVEHFSTIQCPCHSLPFVAILRPYQIILFFTKIRSSTGPYNPPQLKIVVIKLAVSKNFVMFLWDLRALHQCVLMLIRSI